MLIWYADKINKLNKFLIRTAAFLITLGESVSKYNSKIISEAEYHSKQSEYHSKQSDIYERLSSNK